MKRLITISAIVIILVIASGMTPLAPASGAEVTGTVAAQAGTLGFSGELNLMSDGTIAGSWVWAPFVLNGSPVRFRCNEMTALSFPDKYTAVFSGTFTCTDFQGLLHVAAPASCGLEFVLIEKEAVNNLPQAVVDVIPPGVTLSSEKDTLMAYCENGAFIWSQQGDYSVEAN